MSFFLNTFIPFFVNNISLFDYFHFETFKKHNEYDLIFVIFLFLHARIMFLHLITDSLNVARRPRNVFELVRLRDRHSPHDDNGVVAAPAALRVVNLREVVVQQLPLVCRPGHEALAVPGGLVELDLLSCHDVVQVDCFGNRTFTRKFDALHVLDEPAGDNAERLLCGTLGEDGISGLCVHREKKVRRLLK